MHMPCDIQIMCHAKNILIKLHEQEKMNKTDFKKKKKIVSWPEVSCSKTKKLDP